MRLRVSVLTLLAVAFAADSGSDLVAQASTPTTFEAASVKVAQDGQFGMSPMGTDRFSVRGLPLPVLMAFAFGTEDDRVLGGPSWVRSESYDINAKADDGVLLTWDNIRPLLRALLAERFKLVAHKEERQADGYALVVDRGTPRLKPAAEGASQFGVIRPAQLGGASVTMGSFASLIGRALNQPVVDETHIDGQYEIALRFSPTSATNSDGPSIFTAVQEQMGLRLDRRKVPITVVVIDHVEHPTDD